MYNNCYGNVKTKQFKYIGWKIISISNREQLHGPLTRYVKLQVAHAPGMPGTFPPAAEFKWKLLLSDPGMHHGTCVTHVSWCMSGSLTHGGGENVPGIPGACASAILRIWQEAHVLLPESNTPFVFKETIIEKLYHCQSVSKSFHVRSFK